MKKITALILLVLFVGLADNASAKLGGIDSIFKAHKLRGSFVMLDYSANKFTIFNEARCRKRFSPASTFKLPNTLIALELGIIKDTNYLFKWDGTPRRMKVWDKDMNIAEAMRLSCVPCYQEIARNIGLERMKTWIDKFNYGNKTIGDTVDRFWLNDTLKISQFEQIEFLKRLYFNSISAKKKNVDILKSIIIKEKNAEYKISGKTGTVLLSADKLIGWYVGYVERDNKVYFFATNIDAKIPREGLLNQERIDLTYDILEYLKIID